MSELPLRPPHSQGSHQRLIEEIGAVSNNDHKEKSNAPIPQSQQQVPHQSSSKPQGTNDGPHGENPNDAIVEYSPHGTWLTWLKSVSDTPRSRRNNNNNQSIRVYERQALRLPPGSPNRSHKINMKTLDDADSNETERTTAESATYYDQRHRKSLLSKKQTLPLPEQEKAVVSPTTVAGRKAANSIISVRKDKIGKLKMLRLIIDPVKKHPWVVALAFLILSIVSLALLAVTIWWLVPLLIQTSINYTTIQIKSVSISDPKINSFHLQASSIIEKPNFHSAEVEPFDADVFYLPNEVTDFSKNYMRHSRQLGDASSTLYIKKLDTVERLNVKDLKPYYIGTLFIPYLNLKNDVNSVDYNTRFHIENSTHITEFIRDLLMTDSATWYIYGSPSIKAIGMKYDNFHFLKPITFKGMKITPSSGYNDNGRSGKEVSLTNQGSFMELKHLDLTMQTVSDIKAIATIELIIGNDSVSLSSLGIIELGIYFQNALVFLMKSSSTVSLSKGRNILNFDVVERGSLLNKIKQDMINPIFQALTMGQEIVVDIKGISSSVPLYNEAIKYLHVKLPINLQKFNSSTNPFIESSYIEEVEINGDNPNQLAINLKMKSLIHNFLGSAYPFRIEKSFIMAKLMPSTSKKPLTANGVIEARKFSRPMQTVDFNKVLKSSLHEIYTDALFTFAQDQTKEDTVHFIRSFIEQNEIVIDSNFIVNSLQTVFESGKSLNLPNIVYKHNYVLKGFSHLAHMKLSDDSELTEKNNMSTYYISLEYENPTQILLSAGPMNIKVTQGNHSLFTMSSSNFELRRGRSKVRFTFSISKADKNKTFNSILTEKVTLILEQPEENPSLVAKALDNIKLGLRPELMHLLK